MEGCTEIDEISAVATVTKVNHYLARQSETAVASVCI